MIDKILKRNHFIYLIITGVLASNSYCIFGQGQNEEVNIIAPYIPSISDASKIPFRPGISQDEQVTPTFKYEYVTKKLETQLELSARLDYIDQPKLGELLTVADELGRMLQGLRKSLQSKLTPSSLAPNS